MKPNRDLTNKIQRLYVNKELLNKFSHNSYLLFEKKFDSSIIYSNYTKFIEKFKRGQV